MITITTRHNIRRMHTPTAIPVTGTSAAATVVVGIPVNSDTGVTHNHIVTSIILL